MFLEQLGDRLMTSSPIPELRNPQYGDIIGKL